MYTNIQIGSMYIYSGVPPIRTLYITVMCVLVQSTVEIIILIGGGPLWEDSNSLAHLLERGFDDEVAQQWQSLLSHSPINGKTILTFASLISVAIRIVLWN